MHALNPLIASDCALRGGDEDYLAPRREWLCLEGVLGPPVLPQPTQHHHYYMNNLGITTQIRNLGKH